ncbi:hypothetical protein F2P81_025041 [Scophthalmus maximus]|uniref:Uncharacterized protein n=1 Tax=Scophthalmus maximus TaxID=52904 RepID=A0A6A4RQW4_SCOMX|nr:hypothetical protein F2P81_025041 [Scophthalmus maximus]
MLYRKCLSESGAAGDEETERCVEPGAQVLPFLLVRFHKVDSVYPPAYDGFLTLSRDKHEHRAGLRISG